MKKFIFGLILGAGLTFGLSAHAEVTNLVGQIIEGQFPVKVEEKVIESPGIVVNGTSYLPVREFGEMLGYDVSFNADMGVELKKKETSIVPTNDTLSKEKIESEIESIQGHLDNAKEMLRVHEHLLNDNPDVEVYKEAIEKLKKDIEELEAEKTELEAQLNGTEE